jgi:tetratricopeptide (TPR) repeat protein
LRDEPLVTVPPGPIRRALKYVRRHPTGVTAVLATVVVLVATAGIGWAMGRARDHKVNGLTDRANQLGREKRFTEATDLMKEALDLRPNHALAWSSFCWLQREWLDHDRSMRTRERLDDAEKTCRRALELDPENVYTTNYLAHVFRMLGRPQEAVQLYKSILDRSPEYYFVWSSLGATYASMGDLNLAEESLQKGAETAKKMESGSETKWVGMTLRNLASLELHLKKPDAAIHAALALEVYDKDPATLALVARIEMEKSPTNFEPIIERIQNADFMASGADPLILRIRSFVHLWAGQFEHARDYARKALEGKDEPATHARLILAVALAQLKDSAVARDALHIAIQEWPEDLREPSAYRATIEKGVLWFESAEELFQLRDQAERLIAATSPSP